ncbi:RTA1 like protein-domain-containing protein [Gautieria morchelliformis]|nr:RTA1 like protein-domain-containing protein [Gautieria morchelliformis]
MPPLLDIARAVVNELAARKSDGEEISPYGYIPTQWICILYVALFGVTTAIHFVQVFYIKPRSYWMLPTVVMCGMGELIGWGARLWSSITPHSQNAFLMQITTTIISPTFMTAAFYTMLGRIISRLGPQFARMSPRVYVIVFITADLAALIVQAVGGAQASTAANPEDGAHVMLIGIFLQQAGIAIYMILGAEFLWRFRHQKPLRKFTAVATTEENESFSGFEKPRLGRERGVMSHKEFLMVNGLIVATLLVLIRSVYRSIELTGGWTGPIITTEWYFNAFDGAPITLAMVTLNIFHPGFLLRD